MFFSPHHHTHMSSSSEAHASLPIPTVYEQLPVQPTRWEYQVLSLETSEGYETKEGQFLEGEPLNALGRDGWMMIGLLDERATGRGTKVHYYFMRQLYS